MRGARGVIGWGLAVALALLTSISLLFGVSVRTDAQEAARWEALGPEGQAVERLFTPASGALLARGKEALLRSDDGGKTWRAITPPEGTGVVTVSPQDHQLLYAAGNGVYRSDDGGDSWQMVSEETSGQWIKLELSPADPSLLYGVALVSSPADYGTNRDLEFRVSHDAGATWETVRTQHERVVPGTQPCGYAVPLLQPDSVSTVRVYTIEGCTGRGDDPISGVSPDEGRTVALFPDLENPTWGAHALVGGAGVRPERWYVSLFNHGIPNGNSRKSRIMRTDDGGTSWKVVVDAAEWPSTTLPRNPIDFSRTLAYNPRRPDDVYAVFAQYEPDPESSSKPSKLAGTVVRVSHDAGETWTDLGAPDAPSVAQLVVGVDGRYLFAATEKGVYRVALP